MLPNVLSLRLLIHLLMLRPLLRFVFGVNVVGRENLRGLDQFILAANHNSHLDVLLLYMVLPVRQILRTHPVAAKDYFSKHGWIFAAVNYLFQPIWVDRVHKGGAVMDEIRKMVDLGCNIIIFPEGTRGEPGQIQQFRPGIGRLVESHRDLPVVPVFLVGPERSLPKKAPFPLPLWNHVIVGLPQLLKGECNDVVRSLQESIESLARSEYGSRHKRKLVRRESFTIAVLGIDGSGKSTLSRRLASELSDTAGVGLISDTLEMYEARNPKGMQPLLMERVRVWIGRQAKQAKSLARYKTPKLTELLLRDRVLDETKRWYSPDVIVMDGCPLLNMTAWAIMYREEYFSEDFCARAMAIMSGRERRIEKEDRLFEQFPELSSLKRLRLNRLRIPDAVVFIDVDPEVAMDRIEARGERKQVHETEEKLNKLRKAYLIVCRVIGSNWQVPVCQLEGKHEIESIVSEALNFAEKVRSAKVTEG